MKGEGQGAVAEVALQYYDNSYNELLLSFANNVPPPRGGTHEEGFKLAPDPCAERVRPRQRAF